MHVITLIGTCRDSTLEGEGRVGSADDADSSAVQECGRERASSAHSGRSTPARTNF